MTRIELAIAIIGTAALLGMASCGGGQKSTEPASPSPVETEAAAEADGGDAVRDGAGDPIAPAAPVTGEGGLGADGAPLSTDPGAPARADSPGAGAGPSGTIGDTGMTREQIAERAMAMFRAMAEAAQANKDDCDAMADAMAAIVAADREIIAAAQQLDQNPEVQAWFEQTYGPEIKEIMGKMLQPMMGCQDNQKLKKVFEELQ